MSKSELTVYQGHSIQYIIAMKLYCTEVREYSFYHRNFLLCYDKDSFDAYCVNTEEVQIHLAGGDNV